jgi:hypothetical protein
MPHRGKLVQKETKKRKRKENNKSAKSMRGQEANGATENHCFITENSRVRVYA